MRRLTAFLVSWLSLCAPALAQLTPAQLQNENNTKIVTGVPGGIKAPTLHTLLGDMIVSFAPLTSINSGALTALGIAPNTTGGFATWPVSGGGGSPTAAQIGFGVMSALELGMVSNTTTPNFDNAPFIGAISTAFGFNPPGTVDFPVIFNNAIETEYYFSAPVLLENAITLECHGGNSARHPGAWITVAAGQDGIFNDGPFGGQGGAVNGCGIQSLGFFMGGQSTNGNNQLPSARSAYANAVTGNIAVPAFAVGDTAIVKGIFGFDGDGPLVFKPGSTVTAVSGTSATSPVTLTMSTNALYTSSVGTVVYRLPAALAQPVTTTSGSATVTTVGGTYLFKGGEKIWSDAFPFGTTVESATGSLGAQTLVMTNLYDNVSPTVNATATHTAGSGKLWVVPEGLRRRSGNNTHGVYIKGFPIGVGMSCSSQPGQNTGCIGSQDFGLGLESNLIGYLKAGNETAVIDSYGMVTKHNYWVDIFEGGALGSSYFGDNYNSYEDGNAVTGILMQCNTENFSSWFGGYWSTNTSATMGICADATDPYNAPPQGVKNNTVAFWGAQQAVPWGVPSWTGNGIGGTYFEPGGLGSVNCIKMGGGTDSLVTTFSTYTVTNQWSHTCINNDSIDFSYETTWGWGFSNFSFTDLMFFTDPSVFTPYSAANTVNLFLPAGFILGTNPEPGATTAVRMFDEGAAVPTQQWRAQGDVRFNNAPVAGGNFAWCNLTSGTTATPAGAGVAWSICGLISNQAAVPDYTATTWRLTPVAISALPTCTAALAVTTSAEMAVNNGTAYGTGAYGSAVSATGAVTRRVLCTNTGGPTTYAWAYN